MDSTHPDQNPRVQRTAMMWLLTVIVVILSGWALRATATVFVPLVLAFFLTLIVHPLDRKTAERLPSRVSWLGHVVALLAVLLGVGIFIGCLWVAAEQIVARFENAGDMSMLSGLDLGTADDGNDGKTTQLEQAYASAVDSLQGAIWERVSGFANGVVNTAGTTLGGLILVLFLTLLMLIEAPKWGAKMQSAASQSTAQELRAGLGVFAHRLMRYLITRTILGLITALLYVGWMWIFDLDLLIVWGLLAFLLNFIPTLGSMIAGVLPVIYAFVQKDFSTAFLIGSGLLVIEQVMGNFVDPRVQGRQVSISPLVILVVLVLWGWIWGIMGAILAVPITIAAIIGFAHFEPLRPFALFLSNENSMDDLDCMAQGEDG
ncbi:AI-2E family transporter [Pseudosulfitobacter koreensis]|uniref:AI-2E family transporter n=1 Tax=Pseudosulfitobacter koreensis TaxID=2968472 RepID=A0ABT1Z0M4_9RHOB|nr:AI-2E family transporter [Pseudosulfitobacter koreense]MCR8826679.1 AI-2E family transporter [Pseudosulfitobacter koreense]